MCRNCGGRLYGVLPDRILCPTPACADVSYAIWHETKIAAIREHERRTLHGWRRRALGLDVQPTNPFDLLTQLPLLA